MLTEQVMEVERMFELDLQRDWQGTLPQYIIRWSTDKILEKKIMLCQKKYMETTHYHSYCQSLLRQAAKMADRSAMSTQSSTTLIAARSRKPSHRKENFSENSRAYGKLHFTHRTARTDQEHYQFFRKGKGYDDREHIHIGLRALLDSKSPEFYAKGIHDFVGRWQKVVGVDWLFRQIMLLRSCVVLELYRISTNTRHPGRSANISAIN